MPRRIICSILFLIFSLMAFQIAHAQAGVAFTELPPSYVFGDQITFQARYTASASAREATITFQAEGSPNAVTDRAEIAGDMLIYRFNVPAGSIRPFAGIGYRFTITFDDGGTAESPAYRFDYVDNRYPWQTLEDELVRIHWYAGDVNGFGQKAFDVAHIALQKINRIIPVALSEPADIYIYASGADLQSALNSSGQIWVAGHTNPDLGVMMISIAPGPEQGLEMERQIPHELGHILLYQSAREKYFNLPAWLREGISTNVEFTPNPDHARALKVAAQDGKLIVLGDLCTAFPLDASGAFLAYAESASFTQYIVDHYGNTGLFKLINAYGDNLDCEQGAARALGEPLSVIENNWRKEALGENPGLTALENMSPFILILVVVLIAPLWQAFAINRKKDGAQRK